MWLGELLAGCCGVCGGQCCVCVVCFEGVVRVTASRTLTSWVTANTSIFASATKRSLFNLLESLGDASRLWWWWWWLFAGLKERVEESEHHYCLLL